MIDILRQECKNRRIAKGLKLKDVADPAGITPGALLRFERGEIGFKPDTCQKVAHALGFDFEITVTIKDHFLN